MATISYIARVWSSIDNEATYAKYESFDEETAVIGTVREYYNMHNGDLPDLKIQIDIEVD